MDWGSSRLNPGDHRAPSIENIDAKARSLYWFCRNHGTKLQALLLLRIQLRLGDVQLEVEAPDCVRVILPNLRVMSVPGLYLLVKLIIELGQPVVLVGEASDVIEGGRVGGSQGKDLSELDK